MRHSIPFLWRSYAVAAAALFLFGVPPYAFANDEADSGDYPFAVDEQMITFVYEDVEAAANATVELEPLPGGAPYAVTFRHVGSEVDTAAAIRDVEDTPARAVWYLRADETLTPAIIDEARKWLSAGHEIGSQGLSDGHLPWYNRGYVFTEMALSRARLEAVLQVPVLSFSFPNDSVSSPEHGALLRDFAELLRRAGYVHAAAPMPFVGSRPEGLVLSALESTFQSEGSPADRLQAMSGDEAVAEAGPAIMLDAPAPSSVSPVSLGELFTKAQPWHSLPTEVASYMLQRHPLSLSLPEADGVSVRVSANRPAEGAPAWLGPVAFLAGGTPPGSLVRVASAGANTEISEAFADGTARVFVGPTRPAPAPRLIGLVENPRNEPEPGTADASAMIPGLRAWLHVRGPALVMTLQNESGHALEDIRVTFRNPMGWDEGVRTRWIPSLPDGVTWNEAWTPGETSGQGEYRAGETTHLAELTFDWQDKRARLHLVSHTVRPAPPDLPKGHFAVMGPIPPVAFTPELAEEFLSHEDVTATPLQLPSGKVFSWRGANSDGTIASSQLGQEYVRTSGVWHNPDTPVYLLASTIHAGEPIDFELHCEHHFMPYAYLNGERLEEYKGTLREGANEFVLAYHVYDQNETPSHAAAFIRLAFPNTGGRITTVRYQSPLEDVR